MTKTPPPSLAIIGAGPAGLMAAEQLSCKGYSVSIYDQMPMPGRKFLMAGRGGLNLTHSETFDQFVTRYGEAKEFLAPLIQAFSPDELRAWCDDLGESSFIGSSGRIFPKSFKASPLLRAWLRRLETQGVKFFMRHEWKGFTDQGALHFHALGKDDILVKPDAVVLALGGASWPKLGATGAWQNLLRDKDIAVTPLTASNVGVNVPWSEYFISRFAGQPIKRLILSCDEHHAHGEAMIAHYGLEGGALYALSPILREALKREGSVTLSLDLRRDFSESELVARLKKPRGKKSLSTFLSSAAGLDPLSIALVRESFLLRGEKLPDQAEDLARAIKACTITVREVQGLDRAISSAGGIAREEIDQNLMIKKMPGVFVAGEMMDWDAPTGGYLLQACFSTAVTAARGIITWLHARNL